jgi:hypothetical protein
MKTLLQKLLDRRGTPAPNSKLSREMIEDGEVLVAWVKGEVDSAEVLAVLDIKSTGQIHQRAGTTLRNLARGGYISITWNQPEKEE